jgi:dihydroorotate dehydrogenase electron transfer subunit
VSGEISRARIDRGEVVSVEHLGGGLIEVTARLAHLAATAAPGEFAQLRCGEGFSPLLRRPFSVAWTDGDSCSFVFEVVGTGTAMLARLRPGDMLDALGPLGCGFTVDVAPGRVVCVSGGLGCAPFPILVRTLRSRGVADIVVLNGAATAQRLYPADRFQRGDATVSVIEATDDGSRGYRGLVNDLVADAIRGGTGAVFACGPNAMLASLAELLDSTAHRERTETIVEASLEAPMGCGFGTCLGCALPVRAAGGESAWALCCSDGPVMPMAAVDWRALRELPAASVA